MAALDHLCAGTPWEWGSNTVTSTRGWSRSHLPGINREKGVRPRPPMGWGDEGLPSLRASTLCSRSCFPQSFLLAWCLCVALGNCFKISPKSSSQLLSPPSTPEQFLFLSNTTPFTFTTVAAGQLDQVMEGLMGSQFRVQHCLRLSELWEG